MSASSESVIRSLADHATGGMDELVLAMLQWVEDTGNVEDLDWCMLTKVDIEGLSEALYSVATRLEEILLEKGVSSGGTL